MQKEGRLYLNKDGIVACKRREEDRVLYKYNAIVLQQLYQTEPVAWDEKGMREMGNSMSVMPTGQGSKEVAISFTIDRVV